MDVLLKEPVSTTSPLAYLTKAKSQNELYAEDLLRPPGPHFARRELRHRHPGLRRAQMEAEQTLGVRSQLIL